MNGIRWFLLALVLLSPLFTPPFLSYPAVTGPALLVRFITPVLLVLFVAHKGIWPAGTVAYALAAYAAVLLITTVTSIDPLLSLQGTPWRMTGTYDQLLWVLLAAMLPWLVQERWRMALSLAAMAGGLLAVAAIHEWAWVYHFENIRVTGVAGNQGLLGVALLGTIPGALLLSATWKRYTWPWLLVAALAVMALHLSGTRAAIGGACLALGLLFLFYREARVTAGIAAATLVLLHLTIGPMGGADRAILPSGAEAAVSQRGTSAGIAIESAMGNPFTGTGPGTFIYVDRATAPDALVRMDSPHNLALQELSDKGLLGLVTFVLIGLTGWNLWRCRKGYGGLFLAVLVGLLFYGSWWFLSWHMAWWLMLVVGYALRGDGQPALAVETQQPGRVESGSRLRV